MQTNGYKGDTSGKIREPVNWKYTAKNMFSLWTPQHLASYPRCPAKAALCNYCRKIGHFTKVCCSSHSNQFKCQMLLFYGPIQPYAHCRKQKILYNVEISAAFSGQSEASELLETGSVTYTFTLWVNKSAYFENRLLVELKWRLVCSLKNQIPVRACLPATENLVQIVCLKAILGGDLFAALQFTVFNGHKCFSDKPYCSWDIEAFWGQLWLCTWVCS